MLTLTLVLLGVIPILLILENYLTVPRTLLVTLVLPRIPSTTIGVAQKPSTSQFRRRRAFRLSFVIKFRLTRRWAILIHTEVHLSSRLLLALPVHVRVSRNRKLPVFSSSRLPVVYPPEVLPRLRPTKALLQWAKNTGPFCTSLLLPQSTLQSLQTPSSLLQFPVSWYLVISLINSLWTSVTLDIPVLATLIRGILSLSP